MYKKLKFGKLIKTNKQMIRHNPTGLATVNMLIMCLLGLTLLLSVKPKGL